MILLWEIILAVSCTLSLQLIRDTLSLQFSYDEFMVCKISAQAQFI